MNAEAMAALRARLESNADLRARFEASTSEAEIVALAADAGIIIDSAGVVGSDELSDVELESVSGGYTFPRTDWVYCDNPWTNAWCTLKC